MPPDLSIKRKHAMRNYIIVFFIILTLIPSCTSTKVDSRQLKIAYATRDLGEAYMAQKNYTAALKELLNAEKIIPEDPFLHNDLGLTYMAKKHFELAEKHFNQALLLKPDYIPAKNNLGSAYLKQKKWDQAIICFKEISGNMLYATPHFPLSNIGWAFIGKGDYKSAEHYFYKSLEELPYFVNAVHGLATIYLNTSRTRQALALLKKATSKVPEAAILHADLAKAYSASGQHSKARRSWETVISLAPESRLAQEAEKSIYKNKAY